MDECLVTTGNGVVVEDCEMGAEVARNLGFFVGGHRAMNSIVWPHGTLASTRAADRAGGSSRG